MIQVHIITKELEQVREITELLIDRRLITGVTLIDTVSSFKNDKDEIETGLTNLLIGRTRAVLFSTIEKVLKEKYGDDMPLIYGMPIVNMDLGHMEKLKEVVDVEVSNNMI